MYLDLNADVGESFGQWSLGDDDALLSVVSSANVACGFHAGDPMTLRATCERAARRGVAVGAHVAYPDLVGFGRRFLDASREEVAADVLYQLSALGGIAASVGTRVTYVKPHGALYNTIVHHEAQARGVVDALLAYRDPTTGEHPALLGLPGSVVLDIAEQEGLRAVREAFADRAYTPEGTLVPRREPGAVLHDPAQIADRVVHLARTGRVAAVDGTDTAVGADSVCVHGDSPGAVEIARRVRSALEDAGIELRAFAPAREADA